MTLSPSSHLPPRHARASLCTRHGTYAFSLDLTLRLLAPLDEVHGDVSYVDLIAVGTGLLVSFRLDVKRSIDECLCTLEILAREPLDGPLVECHDVEPARRGGSGRRGRGIVRRTQRGAPVDGEEVPCRSCPLWCREARRCASKVA